MGYPEGTRLGPYEIVALLGAGGMGEVYRARDPRLGREVAIKVLPSDVVQDPDRLRRFEHEARAAGALNHPNILAVHDVGSHDGNPFVVSELLDGETLRERIRAGLSTRKAIDYGVQIAHGLAAAHGKGIVHRDLKPENVFVTREGRVKILDFGLAKLRETRRTSEDATVSRTTEAGAVVGTPGYMSPEQVRGLPADRRSDIFSFGAMLYEMLSGRKAFQGATAAESMSAILKDDPGPLDATGRIAPALERIVRRCLEKRPGERFQSAEDLAFALQALSEAGEPSIRRPRRRSVLALVGGLIVVSAALIAIGVRVFRRAPAAVPPPIRSIAVLPLDNLSRDPEQDYFADGMTDALIGDLAKIGSLRVISRTSAMRYKGTKKSMPEIARELNVDALVEGSVLRSGDRVRITAQLIRGATDEHVWSESYERDLRDVLALQRELAQAMAQQIRIKLTPEEQARLASAPPVDPEVYQAYLKGRHQWHKRSEESLVKAIAYFQQSLDKDPAYAPAYAGLADSYTTLGTVGIGRPPQETRPLALAAARKALALDTGLAEAHVSLANASFFNWDWPTAEQGFERAIALRPNDALAHSWFSNYLAARGRLEEAVRESVRATELDPLSPTVQWQLAFVLRFARRYDEALKQLHRVLELDPDYLFAHWTLGAIYMDAGRFGEAIAPLQKAVTLSERGPTMVAALARAHALAGQRAEALTQLRELMELSRRRYISPGSMVEVYLALGNKDQAFEWLEKGYQERSYNMPYLAVLPPIDPLRSDPRFLDLLRRIGLPLSAASGRPDERSPRR